MSIVIAFDTATDRIALAVGELTDDGIRLIAEEDIDAPRAALSRLMPATLDILDRSGLTAQNIDEVVVGVGPGSFTGVRIGVSHAKGFAHGLGCPLYAIGTAEGIAWRFSDTKGSLAVVTDAMRREVYPALFEVADESARRITADAVMSPEDAADMLAENAGDSILLTGSGLSKHVAIF